MTTSKFPSKTHTFPIVRGTTNERGTVLICGYDEIVETGPHTHGHVRCELATFAPAPYQVTGMATRSAALRRLVEQILEDAEAIASLAGKLEREGY